ncbi:hypothetical protein GIB67_017773 [Kingdonia uniflora]|uniref:Pentatricopeptide repeat-containing protein n=1 Tax=Kingdonia uniflora TaxID=39325 RepID=A0A7J7MP93_9MAGN|nr:hypothetical protein GIB67_017773 [Kingdonia uniflora]
MLMEDDSEGASLLEKNGKPYVLGNFEYQQVRKWVLGRSEKNDDWKKKYDMYIGNWRSRCQGRRVIEAGNLMDYIPWLRQQLKDEVDSAFKDLLGDMQRDQTLLGDKAPQGGHLQLEFDDNASIIGEYRAKFATKCGELAKTHASPIIRDWRLVAKDVKKIIRDDVCEKENPRLKVKRTHPFMACHTKVDGTFPEPMREKMEVLTTVVQNILGLVDENFDQDAVSNEMLQLGIELDEFCVAIGIVACAHSGALRQGISVEVFDGLFERNEYSWAAMIGGFALHGLANQAICSLERMVKEDGVCPNGVVFLGVLTACTHAGLKEEGTDLLKHMEGRYGVVPKHEHYSCTVNLLCRAGRLDKALELIRRMIMKPLASVWGALLSA